MEHLLLLIAFALLVFGSNADTERGRKKNIVFILTDDQDQQMESLKYMKHVQSLLMDEGTHYRRHYAPTALCCPARVSILTGLHAHNHGVTSVSGINGGYKEVVKNGFADNYLPIWLQNHGYDTYYTGKLYNGMDEERVKEHPVQGWTEADLLIGGHTYQYWHPDFQHIEGNNYGRVKRFKHKYNTNKVADYGFGYIEKAIKKDKPFFIGIAPVTPHSQVGHNAGPPVPAPEYKGTLRHASVPRSKNFNPEQRSGVNFVWQLERLNQTMEKKLDKHYRRRVESLQTVDDIVKGVVHRLKKAGKLDDTYIIYTSDNGFHLGHHRLFAGKKFAFEEDINVPLIIRGPGVPNGLTTDIVSAHVDIAPTIFKMAGIERRRDFDGKPIALTRDRIEGRTRDATDEHTAVEFWEGASFLISGFKGKRPNAYKSVRLVGKDYDLMYAVHCFQNSKELYDMTIDPVQMNNLHPNAPFNEGTMNAFDSGNTELLGYPIQKLLWRLDALLLVLKSCKAKECRRPWHQLHPHGQVKNLKHAMHERFDDLYRELPRVHFKRCYTEGVINLHAEGPQWSPRLLHHHGAHPPRDATDSEDDSDMSNDWKEALMHDDQQILGYDENEADEEVDDTGFDWDPDLLDDWE